MKKTTQIPVNKVVKRADSTAIKALRPLICYAFAQNKNHTHSNSTWEVARDYLA